MTLTQQVIQNIIYKLLHTFKIPHSFPDQKNIDETLEKNFAKIFNSNQPE